MVTRKLTLMALGLCLCLMDAVAQDWKSVLSGVAKTVVGDKATTAESMVGTWKYSAPDCQFESENLLAKAGGEAASAKIESKLESVYQKVGIDKCEFTFKQDTTYELTVNGKKASGTYSFDAENKTVTMKTRLGVSVNAHVAVTGSTMSMQFKADKLMSAIKALTNLASKVNSSASTVDALVENYDGLMLGFELTKQ